MSAAGAPASGGASAGSAGQVVASGGALMMTSGGTNATSSGGVETVSSGGVNEEGGTSGGEGGASRGGGASGGAPANSGGMVQSSSGGRSAAGSGGAGTAGAEQTGGADTAPCLAFGAPAAVGKAEASALSTLSGLVASRSQSGVLFANPDRSGPRFFAIDKAGHTLAAFELSGATSTDLEDLAIGPGPKPGSYLYIGDIGDNAARPGTGSGRKEIGVFRLPEPMIASGQSAAVTMLSGWESFRFTYPDRPHDSEALMIDPSNGDYLIVSREQDGSAVVFRAPGSVTAGESVTLERVASLQAGAEGVNAADMSPTGDRVLLRTYEAALLFSRPASSSWATVFAAKPVSLPVANEAQSEGATFGPDGKSWLSSGEADPTIYEAHATCP